MADVRAKTCDQCGALGALAYELKTPTATLAADLCASHAQPLVAAFEIIGRSRAGGTLSGRAWLDAIVVPTTMFDHGTTAPDDPRGA